MKKLIILTGISGTGKTSMAKYVQKKLENVTVITVDTILENICDIVGFKNKQQKNKIRLVAKQFSKKLLKLCMERLDEIIIMEYPFSEDWKNYFTKMSKKYEYDVLTVKMYGESFEEIWRRVCIRDLSEERHIIHESEYYDVKNKNKMIKRNLQKKNVLKKIYEEEKRTKITIGDELKIISSNGESQERAFQEIKAWIEKE